MTDFRNAPSSLEAQASSGILTPPEIKNRHKNFDYSPFSPPYTSEELERIWEDYFLHPKIMFPKTLPPSKQIKVREAGLVLLTGKAYRDEDAFVLANGIIGVDNKCITARVVMAFENSNGNYGIKPLHHVSFSDDYVIHTNPKAIKIYLDRRNLFASPLPRQNLEESLELKPAGSSTPSAVSLETLARS